MKIIIVTGQTATGKTKVALDLAKEKGGALVNFDSRHIYQYLDIVSGKDLDLIRGVEFLLHSFLDPKEYFSSFDYAQKAFRLIEVLDKKAATVVFVGGTYLYIYNLLYGIDTKVEPDWPLRKNLEKKTVRQLQDILKKLSFQSFERLNGSDRSNPRRLMRKIEQAKQKTVVDNKLKFEFDNYFKNFEITMIGLKYKSNELLRRRIEERVGERIKKGGVDEVKKLLDMGYDENDPGLKTIGYQQIIKYLRGKISKEEAIYEWITKEVQYAKRQYTFMKRDPHIQWKEI